MDRRTINVEIFEDTNKLCHANEVLKQAVENSIKNQQIYSEFGELEFTPQKRFSKTKTIVSGKRSFEAAKAYQGKKVCVHNFASATNPGGGVTRGSSAQEECLCRCSTLYSSLNTKQCWDGFYGPHRALHNPVYNDDCIYTPDVVVFKSDTDFPLVMPEEEWYKVNILTCAAPNLRAMPSNKMNPHAGTIKAELTNEELYDLHLKRGGRILDIATANKNDVVILGAFGCGAFQNPPEIVANVYKQLMKDYDGVFETVEFAVYCTEQSRKNFEIFQQLLG